MHDSAMSGFTFLVFAAVLQSIVFGATLIQSRSATLPICDASMDTLGANFKDNEDFSRDCRSLVDELRHRYGGKLLWAGPVYKGDDYEYLVTPWNFEDGRCRARLGPTDDTGGALTMDSLSSSLGSLLDACTDKKRTGNITLGEKQNLIFSFDDIPRTSEYTHLVQADPSKASVSLRDRSPNPTCYIPHTELASNATLKGRPIPRPSFADDCFEGIEELIHRYPYTTTFSARPTTGSQDVKLPQQYSGQLCTLIIYSVRNHMGRATNPTDTFRLVNYRARMEEVYWRCRIPVGAGTIALGTRGSIRFRMERTRAPVALSKRMTPPTSSYGARLAEKQSLGTVAPTELNFATAPTCYHSRHPGPLSQSNTTNLEAQPLPGPSIADDCFTLIDWIIAKYPRTTKFTPELARGPNEVQIPLLGRKPRCAVQLYETTPHKGDIFRLHDYKAVMEEVYWHCVASTGYGAGTIALGSSGTVRFRMWRKLVASNSP